MTRRATFTETELARAIRVADRLGKTAVQTPSGIAFVPPLDLAQNTQPDPDEGDTCAGRFGLA